MKNYIFNLETTKIELHFEKSEYAALSTEQKTKIKSAFLFSGKAKAWVSRAKEPNLWKAKAVAKELGFTEEERQGERITYSEQLEQKSERAEAKAERYETYANNAEKRAETMQKPLNDMRGDTAFFTQPNINSPAGRAFTNYRQKMFDRYNKGFEEYRKSEYFQNRAETARETANRKLDDRQYLVNRIKENQSEIKKRFKNIDIYEQRLKAIGNGETLTKYNGEIITTEETETAANRELELIEVAQDKEAFFTNCLEELGGLNFSKHNIKVGDLLEIQKFSGYDNNGKSRYVDIIKVTSKGAQNVTGKSIYTVYSEKVPYALINKVITE